MGRTLVHEKDSREIVGVVGDAKYEDLRSPAPPTVYEPFMALMEGSRSTR